MPISTDTIACLAEELARTRIHQLIRLCSVMVHACQMQQAVGQQGNRFRFAAIAVVQRLPLRHAPAQREIPGMAARSISSRGEGQHISRCGNSAINVIKF